MLFAFLLLLQPDREDELMRIEGEGGKVINWNGARVFGVLAMSRAIGFPLYSQLHFAICCIKNFKILVEIFPSIAITSSWLPLR